MEYELKRKICLNCGKTGHEFKICNEPITSYGVINFNILSYPNEKLIIKENFSLKKNKSYKIISKKYPEVKCYISNIKAQDDFNTYKIKDNKINYEELDDLQKFLYYKDKIFFMMVSRRFSLGFIEFIRGKYDVYNSKNIIDIFEQMYESEITLINDNDYDDILYFFLNRKNEIKEIVLKKIYEGKYGNEYIDAKNKFSLLQNPDSQVPLDLYFYTTHIKSKWNNAEWGFPKGRRDKRSEENINCAIREFQEETGYHENEYSILDKIEPLEEKLVGTNGIEYRHIYYLALNNCKDHFIEKYDNYEIGKIEWMNYQDAYSSIRPYHVDKKRILTQTFLFIINFLIKNINEI